MEYNKLIEKTSSIITWLDVNDVGSMDTVLRGLITSAQVEGQTDKQYEQFWASIRSLCGTLPNSPIRNGELTKDNITGLSLPVKEVKEASE